MLMIPDTHSANCKVFLNLFIKLISNTMKQKFTFFLAFLMALTWTSSYGQGKNVNVKHIEIEKENGVEFIDCTPIKKNGLIVTTQIDDKQKDATKWHDILTFMKYDTLLKKVKSVDVNCAREFRVSYFENMSNFYRVAMSTRGEYQVVLLDGETMKPSVFEGETGKRTEKLSQQAQGDYVYILGLMKDRPVVVSINVKTGAKELIQVSDLSLLRPNFLSFEVSDKQDEVYLFLKQKENKEYVLKFHVFANGKITKSYTITSEGEERFPTSAYASKMDDGSYLISGTYSLKDRKVNSTSVGVYLKKIENGKTIFSNYTNYSDMKRYLKSHMGEKTIRRVDRVKTKMEEKNKEVSMNYLMLPHRIIEKNGKYIFVAESYEPIYHYETTIGPKGERQTKRVFDGYAYSHYLLLKYNQDGVVEWDNGAPMHGPNLTKRLRRYLSVNMNDNTIDIIQPTYQKLYHTTFGENGEKVKEDEIEYVGDEETLKRVSDLDSDFWYDNTFVSTGLLKIKSDDKKKRNVYNIIKISFPKD